MIVDVAISAPYDGAGIVIIYYGNKLGIQKSKHQILVASTLDNHFRGFGFSISKGLDTDNNGLNGKKIKNV